MEDAWWSIVESIWEVERVDNLESGGSIRTIASFGSRLWWRICDSTAYYQEKLSDVGPQKG